MTPKFFTNSPVANFMKFCPAAITLLCVYTWTDEAVLPGPPQGANAPKNKF